MLSHLFLTIIVAEGCLNQLLNGCEQHLAPALRAISGFEMKGLLIYVYNNYASHALTSPIPL